MAERWVRPVRTEWLDLFYIFRRNTRARRPPSCLLAGGVTAASNFCSLQKVAAPKSAHSNMIVAT
jgi:hypothetical protein